MARRGATNLSGILADRQTCRDDQPRCRCCGRAARNRGDDASDTPARSIHARPACSWCSSAPPPGWHRISRPPEKSYDARIVFGSETDTDDAEGIPSREREAVPDALRTEARSNRTCRRVWLGTHEQVPPAYSAIKRDGVTAHRAARAGEPLELEARTIEVDDAVCWASNPAHRSRGTSSLVVSKGTYIRATRAGSGTGTGNGGAPGRSAPDASGSIPLARHHHRSTIWATAGRAGIEARFLRSAETLSSLPHAEVDTEAAHRGLGRAAP